MRPTAATIAAAAAAAILLAPDADAALPDAPPPAPAHWQQHGCPAPVRVAAYRHDVRRVYRYTSAGGDFRAVPVTRGRHRLERRRECARTERAHRRMTRITGRRAAAWDWHREIDALTPYGKWAIPPYIVYCESHGSWSAYNPSGAVGPYQLLGWGAPMPANTPARMAAHHRIARHVLAVQGLSAWICA